MAYLSDVVKVSARYIVKQKVRFLYMIHKNPPFNDNDMTYVNTVDIYVNGFGLNH